MLSTTWRRYFAWERGRACATSYCRSSRLISLPPPAPACRWFGKSCSLSNCLGGRTVSGSRSGSPFSCSTSPASWPMLSPSSPSCWQSKRFWCSRLNDMSPAGARGRLDVNIKQKSFRAASGGKLHVLGELVFSLRSGELAALVGPSGCGKTTLLGTHNVEDAIGLADRLLLLSISPARIVADVPVARPRAAHTPAELAALRGEIARLLNQPFSRENL